MNNSKELTNREYLSDGTEIRGTGKGEIGRAWNRALFDTSSCKMGDGIYILFIQTAT